MTLWLEGRRWGKWDYQPGASSVETTCRGGHWWERNDTISCCAALESREWYEFLRCGSLPPNRNSAVLLNICLGYKWETVWSLERWRCSLVILLARSRRISHTWCHFPLQSVFPKILNTKHLKTYSPEQLFQSLYCGLAPFSLIKVAWVVMSSRQWYASAETSDSCRTAMHWRQVHRQ